MKYFIVLTFSLAIHFELFAQNQKRDLGHRWVMFTIIVKDAQKRTVYHTSLYNLKTKGIVHLQETINKMKKCLIADATDLHPSIKEFFISDFRFWTYEEGEAYFKNEMAPKINPKEFPVSKCIGNVVLPLFD